MSRILSFGQFKANTPNPPHQLKLPGFEHITNAHPELHTSRHYIRFGHWPEDEHSRNNTNGHKEAGVSVYEAHPHTNEPMDPDPDGTSDYAEEGWDSGADMRGRVNKYHTGREPHAFEVRGTFQGYGHDGEPTIKRIHDVKPWDGGAARRHDYWHDRRDDL